MVGVYSKAAYLKMPAGLAALTTFDVPSGPIHARCDEPLEGLSEGDKVVVAGSLLQAGPLLLDLQGAETWEGRLPGRAALESGRRLALDLLAQAPSSSLDRAVADGAGKLLSKGDLAGAARCLGGVGPGLTPAGDDCLAGILLIAGILGGQTAGLAVIAAAVATNEVARSFLYWAARGQSIESVHRFLTSAAQGDVESAAVALKELTSFGHSSGADLVMGLRLGLEVRH